MAKTIAETFILVIVILALIVSVFAGASVVGPINELHQMHERGESGWER